MWDLIVSVPDHCLSFYFESCDILNMLCGMSVQFDIIIFFIVIPFEKIF